MEQRWVDLCCAFYAAIRAQTPRDISVTPKPPSTAEAKAQSPACPPAPRGAAGCHQPAGAPRASVALGTGGPSAPLRARGSPDLFLIQSNAPRRRPTAPAPWHHSPGHRLQLFSLRATRVTARCGNKDPKHSDKATSGEPTSISNPIPTGFCPFPAFGSGELNAPQPALPLLTWQSRAGQFVDSGQSTRTAKPWQSAVSAESCWLPRRGSSTSLFLSEKCNHFLTWALGERRAARQPPCPRVLQAAGLPAPGSTSKAGPIRGAAPPPWPWDPAVPGAEQGRLLLSHPAEPTLTPCVPPSSSCSAAIWFASLSLQKRSS